MEEEVWGVFMLRTPARSISSLYSRPKRRHLITPWGGTNAPTMMMQSNNGVTRELYGFLRSLRVRTR
jgi:hypothetical protein